jgi:hypothetical protein
MRWHSLLRLFHRQHDITHHSSWLIVTPLSATLISHSESPQRICHLALLTAHLFNRINDNAVSLTTGKAQKSQLCAGFFIEHEDKNSPLKKGVEWI